MSDSPSMVIKKSRCNRGYLIALVVACLAFLVIGFVAGYFVSHNSKPQDENKLPHTEKETGGPNR